MPATSLIEPDENGLFCRAGDFHIDPWNPVPRAVITHAHRDHLVPGCGAYLATEESLPFLRMRLDETGRPSARIETLRYGETRSLGSVAVSLPPAGHIRGSAQVRIECGGEVAVFSGDYKTAADPTCAPFEPVRCDRFITEATFGLPIFRWPDPERVFARIHSWWRANQEAGRASILFAYALGKAQRLLAGLDPEIGPIRTHGAVERVAEAYRAAGVPLAPSRRATEAPLADWSRALVLAPLSARGTPWLRRFGDASTAIASGWMRIRGIRRRRAIDRGFTLSDHADWPALLRVIEATGASSIAVTHGTVTPMVRHLRENGFEAAALRTPFEGERGEIEPAAAGAAELEADETLP